VIKRLQDFERQGLRQVDQKVSEIVELHAFCSGNEILGLHPFDQAITDFVSHFDENITLIVRADHFPEYGALAQRHRFEQAGDFGRVQAMNHQARGPHAAAVELLAQQLQICLGVFSGLHNAGQFTEFSCAALYRGEKDVLAGTSALIPIIDCSGGGCRFRCAG
jgi:hypothetical protein